MNWTRNLVLLINNYWKQQTDNNKTLILFFYRLKTVTPCSKFCINITHLNESEALIAVMSEFFILWRFFTWPRNYYNDNNKSSNGETILPTLFFHRETFKLTESNFQNVVVPGVLIGIVCNGLNILLHYLLMNVADMGLM